MSGIELVTVTVSSIAIGASVVAILLFFLVATLQKRLIIRTGEENTKVGEETAWAMQLFAEGLKDDVPDNDREVLISLIQRYAEASLISVLDDATESGYLFEGLTNPNRLPWEGEKGKRQEGSK